MNPESLAAWGPPAAIAGALLLVLELVVSAAQFAVASLGKVGLHRMRAESRAPTGHLDELSRPSSSYWLTVWVVRFLGLVGGCGLLTAGWWLTGLPRPWLVTIAVGPLVLLVELALVYPLALRYPRAVLAVLTPLLRLLHGALLPVLIPWVALVRRQRVEGTEEPEDSEEDSDAEAEALIEVAEREGILEADEGRMIRGIVDLGDTRVREIMTPRTDIVALEAGVSVRQALRAVREANHTRLPVYRKTIDDVLGILHVRDVIRAWDEGREDDPITFYLRPALFVPETLWVADLLDEMRTRTHIALVVDEYGGIAGLATLEDLLEEIVGEIRDEHDQEEDEIRAEEHGSWLVRGSAHVEELAAALGVQIVVERDYDTVGGMVVDKFGRVPKPGETLSTAGLKIEIVEADPRRVYRVRVRKADDEPAVELVQ